jgi:N-formylglutamate deformylase
VRPYTLHLGELPLLVSVPHAGTWLPPELQARLTAAGQTLPDTDWHVDQLYGFVPALGASLLVAHPSRYVVDLNRPADDTPLYPGQAGTGLVPTETFGGAPLWTVPPSAEERRARVERWWAPYHAALHDTLERIRKRHGYAILWDGHSIRGTVPRLFEGRLPDLNLGTDSGRSASPVLERAAAAALAEGPWSTVSNGRFKGGHITRHCGAPAQGIHALQLEMAWSVYLDEEAPERWDAARAAPVQAHLQRVLEAVLAAGQDLGATPREHP